MLILKKRDVASTVDWIVAIDNLRNGEGSGENDSTVGVVDAGISG